MRIVIDTNCLLQIIGRRSPYASIYRALENKQLKLLLSSEVALEYEEILAIKINPSFAFFLTQSLIENPLVEKIEIFVNWRLISEDPDDNKFLDLALNGEADYLITNDGHFNSVKRISFSRLRIVTLKEFWEIFKLKITS
jgi:putative PIN family toxin of toxin-antitoxin system